jgi:hypothetical protein
MASKWYLLVGVFRKSSGFCEYYVNLFTSGLNACNLQHGTDYHPVQTEMFI